MAGLSSHDAPPPLAQFCWVWSGVGWGIMFKGLRVPEAWAQTPSVLPDAWGGLGSRALNPELWDHWLIALGQGPDLSAVLTGIVVALGSMALAQWMTRTV